MKKAFFIILGLLVTILPLKIRALDITTNINCNSVKIKSGESTSCSITATTDSEISALSMKLSSSTNITISNIVTDNSWQGNGENGSIDLYTDTNKTGTFDIATFTIKAANKTEGSSENLYLKNISYSDKNFVEYTKSDKTQPITILSNINTLSSIKIDNNIIEGFASNINEYRINLNSKSISISVDKTDSKSSVTGDVGTKNINYGENVFKITVTSESKTSNVYNLIITKPEIRRLSTLKLNDKNITLKNGIYQYNFELTEEENSLKIESQLENNNALFVEGYGNRTIENLKDGKTEILIKTQDANNEILTYKIIVNKKTTTKDEPSEDNQNTSEEESEIQNENPTENTTLEETKEENSDEQKVEKEIKNPKTGNYIKIIVVLALIIVALIIYIISIKFNAIKKI